MSKSFLTEAQKDLIINDELDLFHHHGVRYPGASKPTPTEYLLRKSPVRFLPEARVWRFWSQHQRILPLLSVLVRVLAAAQSHSAAAERTGRLFTHDKTAQMDLMSIETTVIRQRAHYEKVVDPMQNMPLDDLHIFNH